MAEPTQTTETESTETSTDETQPSRLQYFVAKHPRAAKVAAIIGVTGTVVGGVMVTKTVSANRRHAIEAGEHAKEALHELSATVTPQENTEA